MGWQPFWLNKVIRLTRRTPLWNYGDQFLGLYTHVSKADRTRLIFTNIFTSLDGGCVMGPVGLGCWGWGRQRPILTAAIATHPLLPLLLLLLPSLRQLAWHSIIQIELLFIPAESLPRHLSFRRG